MTFVWPTSHVGMLHPLGAVGSDAWAQGVSFLKMAEAAVQGLSYTDTKALFTKTVKASTVETRKSLYEEFGLLYVPKYSGTLLLTSVGRQIFSLFYQQTADLLPIPSWIDRRTGTRLRALPDLVVKIDDGAWRRLVILDAKNRTLASESDVAYKLMGYKENLGMTEFQAVGIYPGFSGTIRIRRLEKSGEQILLVHVPLLIGRKAVRRIAKCFLGIGEPDLL